VSGILATIRSMFICSVDTAAAGTLAELSAIGSTLSRLQVYESTYLMLSYVDQQIAIDGTWKSTRGPIPFRKAALPSSA
jgi:hypothetical protein